MTNTPELRYGSSPVDPKSRYCATPPDDLSVLLGFALWQWCPAHIHALQPADMGHHDNLAV